MKTYFETSINAGKCSSLSILFKEFVLAFYFPDFPAGDNLSYIFDEMITDLSWLKENKYVLNIYNVDKFNKFSKEDQLLLKTKLAYINRYWNVTMKYHKYSQDNFIIKFLDKEILFHESNEFD